MDLENYYRMSEATYMFKNISHITHYIKIF